MSTMFLRTLREDPADADVVSDKLLQRACYLRKAAPASGPGCRWVSMS